jgi:hypothetical protein
MAARGSYVRGRGWAPLWLGAARRVDGTWVTRAGRCDKPRWGAGMWPLSLGDGAGGGPTSQGGYAWGVRAGRPRPRRRPLISAAMWGSGRARSRPTALRPARFAILASSRCLSFSSWGAARCSAHTNPQRGAAGRPQLGNGHVNGLRLRVLKAATREGVLSSSRIRVTVTCCTSEASLLTNSATNGCNSRRNGTRTPRGMGILSAMYKRWNTRRAKMGSQDNYRRSSGTLVVKPLTFSDEQRSPRAASVPQE